MNSLYKLSYADWFCKVKIDWLFRELLQASYPLKKLLDLLISIPVRVQCYKIGNLSFYLVLLGTGTAKKVFL